MDADRLKAINAELVEALEWGVERLEVDDGMTPQEQATTARRLHAAIAKAKEDASA